MQKKGFTLMEMLIVVAIVAVLVAVAIPTFTMSREKASRAVDMANARSIQAMLASMIMEEDITFPNHSDGKDTIGVWVLVCRDNNSYPEIYGRQTSAVFCGTNKGVLVNGVGTSGWMNNNTALYTAVTNCLGGADAMHSHSNLNTTVRGIGGWDWYIVEYAYNPAADSLQSRIYSGKAGAKSGFDNEVGKSNLERYMQQ